MNLRPSRIGHGPGLNAVVVNKNQVIVGYFILSHVNVNVNLYSE